MTASSTGRPVLAAHGLGVRLGSRRALTDVDLAVESGTLLVVTGPNGAGKTTLLRALAGVVAPAAGHVTLHGRDLGARTRRELARELCYLPQETWTEFGLSVIDVVRLGRYPHAGPLRALTPEDHRAVRDAMERADVATLAERPLPTLSGGERRRVYLARALAQQAPVLVLDEPTTALDVGHACAVLDMLAAWARDGRTVVLSMHDLVLATRGPGRALLLHEGRVLADGAPADVLTGEAARRAFGVPLVAVGEPGAIVPGRG